MDWKFVAAQWGDREARRREILRAARELLRGKPLAALQMRDVAKRAGVALGTVYTYFDTKEVLFAAVYAERLDEMLDELAPRLASITDLEELFVAFATGHRDIYAEFGRELDLAAMIARRRHLEPAVWDQLVAATGRLLSAVRLIIDRVSAQIDPPTPDPDLVSAVLWSTATGLAEHFTGVRQLMHRYSWDDSVRFAAHTLIRGLIPNRHDSHKQAAPPSTHDTS